MKNPTGPIPQNVTESSRQVHDGTSEAVIRASAADLRAHIVRLRRIQNWLTGSSERLTDADLAGLVSSRMILEEIRDQLIASEALGQLGGGT